MRISKTTKQTIHHVLIIIFHHVSSKSSNQEEIPNLTETGGSKYGVQQGYGCIWRRYPFYIFVCHFLVYADIKDRETNNSSCLIIFHHVSSKSSNLEEIPNLTETGGSKYGVPQGYGFIWRRYPFYIFFFCHFLVYADIKDHETNNSSCLIIFHHVSSKSSNQEEIPNLTETGGSKYGVPQGYGLAAFGGGILFTCFFFAISWFMRLSKTTKQTIHHVLSYFITSHLNQVIRRRSQI